MPYVLPTLPITGVRISIFECGKQVGTRTWEGSASRRTVSGLSDGTTYNFGVQALNRYGAGPLVYSNPVAPTVAGTTPGRVSGVSVSARVAALSVSWRRPATRGTSPIVRYRVSWYLHRHCEGTKTLTSKGSTETIGGLRPNLAYTVSVQAVNASGDGPAMLSTEIKPRPTRPPGPASAIAAREGDHSVRVSWTAPKDPGTSPINGYRVAAFNCDTTATTQVFRNTASTEDVTGLTNGVSYTFGVEAMNAVGIGTQALSAAVSPTGPGLPGPVSAVSATASHYRALVSWDAPINVGGSAITDYRISIVADGACIGAPTFDSTATSEIVDGLTNGHFYRFAVKAVNAFGEGDAVMSNTVTPSPFTMYSHAGGALQGIALGPDGSLWFTQVNREAIGRISTNGTITHYTGAGIDFPYGIAAGPDGALWFTNLRNPGSIGRITTGGAVTNYTDPGIDEPTNITTGPDGALWFTSLDHDYIGRITTGGTVTTFVDPPSMYGVSDLTAGPDGALWFTYVDNSSVGRITTSGNISHFSLDGSIATAIAPGPDGALWFTDPNDNAVGRISTTGDVTRYPVGQNSPTDIVQGPDGAMWFTNSEYSGGIGRITTAGTSTFYSNAGAGPYQIVVGADGNLWYTAADGIGRLSIPQYVNATPNTRPPGTAITVHGGGFNTGETVTVNYDTGFNPPTTNQICQTTADRNGNFQCSGTIPSTNPGTIGDHSITADGHTLLSHATVTYTLT
jgi:virginiamycin B lyase